MTGLPRYLVAAILGVTGGDDLAAQRLARRWQAVIAESAEAADRIRRQVRESRCNCELGDALADERRCSRCFGRIEETGA